MLFTRSKSSSHIIISSYPSLQDRNHISGAPSWITLNNVDSQIPSITKLNFSLFRRLTSCYLLYEQSDKFEKLFSAYAKLVGASPSAFSFRFDGDQLSPSSTPKELEMEDDDIIEVYDKSP